MEDITRELLDRIERAQRENGALAAEVAALRARLDADWPVPARVTTAEAPPVDPDSNGALDAVALAAGFELWHLGLYGRYWLGKKGARVIRLANDQWAAWRTYSSANKPDVDGYAPTRHKALTAALAWHAADAAKGAP
jgi:hypothetical protein